MIGVWGGFICFLLDLVMRYMYVRFMFFVYIVTNKRNGTLYTGHTEDISIRILEHKDKVDKGFTAKYGCGRLVWFETHETRDGAFKRERRIKKWDRVWKLEAVEILNRAWEDLYGGLTHDSVYCDERRYENARF